jgi:hypothetical protein
LCAIIVIWTRYSISAARDDHFVPLVIEIYILILAALLSPLVPWGVDSGIWLLAIVLFLDPAGAGRQRGEARSIDGEVGEGSSAISATR